MNKKITTANEECPTDDVTFSELYDTPNAKDILSRLDDERRTIEKWEYDLQMVNCLLIISL